MFYPCVALYSTQVSVRFLKRPRRGNRFARKRAKIIELIIQMNPKQLEGSILKAVSDAITRVWASEEKEFIQNDSELQNKLEQWLNKTFK